MKKLVTPFRVGLLVIASAAFLFTFLLFVRKGGLDRDESIRVYAYFRDASGLGPRSRVQIAGIPVGEIESIVLEGTRARVWLRIRNEVDLRQDAILTKRSESLLGDYLLDLNPGSEQAPKMEDGGEIRRVIDTQGMEQIFNSLSQITADIQEVTRALRDTLGGEKGQGSMERIVQNLIRLTDALDATARQSGEQLNAILENVRLASADVQGVTSENVSSVNRIIDNVDVLTRDVRDITGTVRQMVGAEGQGDLKDSVASLKQTLARLDRTLANLEEVSTKVKNGEGVAGKLLADDRLGQRLSETVEDVSDLAQRVTGLQAEVGLRSEYLYNQGESKNSFSLRLIPKPDKYYLLEVVDDPRGLVETQVVQTNPPGVGEPVTQVQRITRDTFKFSAQFAKRYAWTTLRFGVIESTGGVGADLHFLNESLQFKFDAFNFSVDELRYPRVRATARVTAFDHLFVTAGLDDAFNPTVRDPTTRELIAGRDFFLGAGFFFTDDDLKAVLTVVPTP